MTQDDQTLRCMFCNTPLHWESDFMRSETGLSPEDAELDQDGIVQVFTCPHCLRTYEIAEPTFEEQQELEYWK